MFRCTDQIQIFAFDLIHHVFFFSERHDTVNSCASDHERRNTVGEALVDHEVTGIGQNGGMQTGNVSHQIIETVTGYPAGCILIQTIESGHDVSMIRNFKIRDFRFAKALFFNVKAVILANWYVISDDIRDHHLNFMGFFV